jgi:hypothetical protein
MTASVHSPPPADTPVLLVSVVNDTTVAVGPFELLVDVKRDGFESSGVVATAVFEAGLPTAVEQYAL